MENIIKNWGIPENLEGNYQYKFDGKSTALKNRLYHMDNGYTFCLIDTDNGKEVAIIDFFPTKGFMGPKSVRIEILYVPHEEYRNKGVASFFVGKIKSFAISIGINILTITVAPNAKIFKFSNNSKGPTKQELIRFYQSFEDDNISVSILNDD